MMMNARTSHFVMRGLDPRIHILSQQEIVDGRDKPGHDEEG